MSEHVAIHPQRRRASLKPSVYGALALAVVVAAAAAWYTEFRPDGNSGAATSSSTSTTNAHEATLTGLRATAQALGHPIYWAGPRANMTYELTVTRSRLVYVRYLTAGVKVGDPRPRFVTIGTYPKVGAYGVLEAAKKLAGAQVQSIGKGGVAVSYANRPDSVYVAYRGSNLMVEVFAPIRLGAKTLVQNGLIAPVR